VSGDGFNDGYVFRDAAADDFEGVWQLFTGAFNESDDQDVRVMEERTFEPERVRLATFGDEIVGQVATYTRDLTVPGAIVPAAHVTLVAVEPTHRRHGLLRRMMNHQLTTYPEPIAVLWATEGRIYQRFGYGLAAKVLDLGASTNELRLLPGTPGLNHQGGTVRAVSPSEGRKILAEVYEQQRAEQPGRSSRAEKHWDNLLADPESRRRGATKLRIALYEQGGTAEGYALWRAKADWSETGPNGETRLVEIVANTPAAYAALWQFLFSIDLSRRFSAGHLAAEEPILYLVDEPRRLGARLGDGLWVRVLDVPAALVARRYAAPLDVVLEVGDAIIARNAGRWRLRAAADGTAVCEPVADSAPEPADLACDVADLGAAYLGGTSLGQLALTGRVRELTPGALRRAAAAFTWHVAPTATEIF
jgi:predicted acetyltransferase